MAAAQLGAEQPIVAGQSYGGSVALAWAVTLTFGAVLGMGSAAVLAAMGSASFNVKVPSYVSAAACATELEAQAAALGAAACASGAPTLAPGSPVYVVTYWHQAAAKVPTVSMTGTAATGIPCSASAGHSAGETEQKAGTAACTALAGQPAKGQYATLRFDAPSGDALYALTNGGQIGVTVSDS